MEPTFSGSRSTISVNFARTVRVKGLQVRVELETGCWVRGSRLALRAGHPVAGGVRLQSRKTFERATEADLDALIRRLRVARCRKPGCAKPVLVGDGHPPRWNRKGLCERHRLKDITDAAAVHETKVNAEIARRDAAKKAKGFRYKATIWIHRDEGDDVCCIEYFVRKPSAAEVRAIARRRRSRILDDFLVEKLP